MKVSVFDTYVKRNDGLLMHFDILVPDDFKDLQKIYGFGKNYLSQKPFPTGDLDAKECTFCHMEQATKEVEEAIKEKGYYILEMQNCN